MTAQSYKLMSQYLIDSLRHPEHGGFEVLETPKKLEIIFSELKDAHFYPYAIQLHKGNKREIVKDILLSITDYFAIEFENHKIIELMPKFGYKKKKGKNGEQPEQQQIFWINSYWENLATILNQLCNKYQIYSKLGI